jgi:hypothetical protein
VSPIGIGFFSLRGLAVLWSELLWVWLPAATIAACIGGVRLFASKPRRDSRA